MENSQPLAATESFSYSWLTNRNPQHSFDNISDQLFNFDFPLASPQAAPVHADQIFSGGHIMPVYTPETTPKKNFKSSDAPPSPAHSRQQSAPPRKARLSSRRFFGGIFGILNPLIRCARKSNRVDDFDRAEFEASPPTSNNSIGKSWNNSPRRSPSSYCGSENSRSCDVESSIREAILYCKKSIEA